MKNNLFSIVLFILFSTLLLLQKDLSFRRFHLSLEAFQSGKNNQDVVYIPIHSMLLKLVAPADQSFISDILWMRTAYYFGLHAMYDKQYPFLVHLLNLTIDTSPKWKLPYYFGATIFPIESDYVEDAYYILERGLGQFPADWRLWFYKGYFQWKSENDLQHAAETLRHASLLPEAPPFLKTLPASLATKTGQREFAVRFLEESLELTTDELQRQILLEKLKKVLREK